MHKTVLSIELSDSDDDRKPRRASGSGNAPKARVGPGSGGGAGGKQAKGKGTREVIDLTRDDDTGDDDDSDIEFVEQPQKKAAVPVVHAAPVPPVQGDGGPAPVSPASESTPGVKAELRLIPRRRSTFQQPPIRVPKVEKSVFRPVIERFLAQREAVLANQLKIGLAWLQERSHLALQTQLAKFTRKATRDECLALYQSYVDLCTSLRVPAFPITAPLVALYLHEEDCAIKSVIDSFERIRLAVLEVWEDGNVKALVTVADEWTELLDDETIEALRRENDRERWEAGKVPDLEAARGLRSRRSLGEAKPARSETKGFSGFVPAFESSDRRRASSELSSASGSTSSDQDEDSGSGEEDDGEVADEPKPQERRLDVADGQVLRFSSDPAITQGLADLVERRESILASQVRRSDPSKQAASNAARDVALLGNFDSKTCRKNIKPVFRAYHDFCEKEHIDPYPIVAEVVALFLYERAYARSYVRNILQYFERTRIAILSIWEGSEGVASAEDALRTSQAACLILQSDPDQASSQALPDKKEPMEQDPEEFSDLIPDMPTAGDRFKSSSAFEDACRNAARAFMGYAACRFALSHKKTQLSMGCSRYHVSPRCQYRVRVEKADDGDWVVNGDTSFWSHNHGRNPLIIADPSYRPPIPANRSASKRKKTSHLHGVKVEKGHVVPKTEGAKRPAPGPADVEREERREKRGKYVEQLLSKPRIPAPSPTLQAAARSYATPTPTSPGPSATGSVPPPALLPLPPFQDGPLSISELRMLLASLSPLLDTIALATVLHRFGVDSHARFANLVFARTEDVKESLEEFVADDGNVLERPLKDLILGITPLRWAVLRNKLAEKRVQFGE
ncbi:hypothetical protein RQP46_001301 [Phenoliferia psychrophenolica]